MWEIDKRVHLCVCGFGHADFCIINNRLVVQVEVSFAVLRNGSYICCLLSPPH